MRVKFRTLMFSRPTNLYCYKRVKARTRRLDSLFSKYLKFLTERGYDYSDDFVEVTVFDDK